jgi:hypothetical protein
VIKHYLRNEINRNQQKEQKTLQYAGIRKARAPQRAQLFGQKFCNTPEVKSKIEADYDKLNDPTVNSFAFANEAKRELFKKASPSKLKEVERLRDIACKAQKGEFIPTFLESDTDEMRAEKEESCRVQSAQFRNE